MYGVTTVLEPHPITGLAWIWNCLVLVVNDHLDVYQFRKKQLLFVRRIDFPTTITCMGHHDETLLMFGTDNVVYSVELFDGDLIINAIAKFSDEGQQLPVDNYRAISATKDWIVLHVFQGLLTVVWKKPRKRNRGREAPPQVETFGIGAIVVIDLVVTANEDIAVLYRDTNYVYSLRICHVDDVQGLVLTKQYDEFNETPQVMVAPPQGGVLVLSPLHIFYFANEGTMVELTDTSTLTTVNMSDHVVTKTLSRLQLEDIQFSTATVVENHKVVVGSQDGRTFIMNFDADRSSKTVNVRRIEIVPLGVTTSAANIHHITGEWFVAASKFSCSTLFKIVPKSPHMKVIQRLDPSPPIMDIIARSNQIRALQGLFVDGNVTAVCPKAIDITVLLEISEVKDVVGANHATRFAVNNKLYEWQKDDYQNLKVSMDETIMALSDNTVITSHAVITNSETTTTTIVPWIDACINEDLIAVATTEEVTILDGTTILASLKIAQVSGLVFAQPGWLIIADWDGNVRVIHRGTELCSYTFEGEAITSMAALAVGDSLEIVVVTGKNEFHQLHMDTKDEKPHLVDYHHGFGGDEQLSLISGDGVIFGHDSKNIVAFVHDPAVNRLVHTTVNHQFSKIDKLKAIAKTLVVLSEAKAYFCSIANYPISWQAHKSFLGAVPVKLIVLNQKLIVLALTRKLTAGKYTANYQLQLYDSNTMKLLDTFTFADDEEIPSMVGLEGEIVCLVNKSSKPFRVFDVANDFKHPRSCAIEGFSNIELALQSLEVIDCETMVVSGSVVFEVKRIDAGRFRYVEDSLYRLPTFSVDIAIVGLTHVLVDLRQGVFVKQVGHKVSQVPLELPLLFPTAVCAIAEEDGYEVFAGDDLGNLTVISWDGIGFTQLLAANLGAQINCIVNDGNNAIVGTVDGGIYKLIPITETEWEHVRNLQTTRNPWKQVDGSTADAFGVVNIEKLESNDHITRDIKFRQFN